MGILSVYSLYNEFVMRFTNLPIVHTANTRRLKSCRGWSEVSRYYSTRALLDIGIISSEAEKWAEMIKGSESYTKYEPPDALWANYVMWEIISRTTEECSEKVTPSEKVRKAVSVGFLLAGQRAIEGAQLMPVTGGDPLGIGCASGAVKTFISLRSLTEHLRNASSAAAKRYNQITEINRRKASGQPMPRYLPHISEDFSLSVREGPFLVSCFAGLYHVQIGSRAFFLTHDLIERLSEWYHSAANYAFSLRDVPSERTAQHIIDHAVRIMYDFAELRPEAVGEFIKASHNYIVASLASDDLLGQPMSSLFLQSLDPYKAEKVLRIVDYLTVSFHSKIDRVNYSHIFKLVLHPDAQLHLSMEKIKGIRQPNAVDGSGIANFEGSLRKAIFMSLKKQDYQVRAEEGEGDGAMVEMINATRCDTERLGSTQALRWAGLRFMQVDHIPDFLSMSVPPSDKASAPSRHLPPSLLREMREACAKQYERKSTPDELKSWKPVNDIQTFLKNTDNLSVEEAWRHFKAVIKAHEAFEARYPGVPIDEIPADDLESFIMENYEIAYLVFTEPKLKEVHKELSRIFYIGEQRLKALTQRVERIARHISKSQVGVSIVKNYAARRRDLEAFADAMHTDLGDTKAAFMSFDMSNFSMKFPMRLVRLYGDILSEVTGLDELKRIDLFFRNSMVVHNTRGYFDFFAGVKGGFEGFLNFVWSSIHAAVMDVAITSAGVKGVLLAYSDDGLLRVDLPADHYAETMRDFVSVVNRVYRSYGLEFHLGKTKVSGVMWEYLGEICLNGRLLPSYFKELITFGKLEKTVGFTSTYDVVSLLTGQARSLVAAHMGGYLPEVMLIAEVVLVIWRHHPAISNTALRAVLLVPPSAGGFRVPSTSEMASFTSISTLAHMIADLSIIEKHDFAFSSSIVGALKASFVPSDKAVSQICTASLLKTDFPDTSGLSSSVRLIEAIISRSERPTALVSHPIRADVEDRLHSVFTTIVNLDPQQVSEIIVNTPDWVKFTNSVAVVKSKGALPLAGRDLIRRTQAGYHRIASQSIMRWNREMIKRRGDAASVDSLYPDLMRTVFSKYRLSNPKMPAKAYFSLDQGDRKHAVTVNINIEEVKGPKVLVRDLQYVEPTAQPSHDNSLLAHMAEVAMTEDQAMVRKFMRVCIAAVCANTGISGHVRSIALIFNVNLPPLEGIDSRRLDNLRGYTRSRPDVTINAPNVLLGRARLRLSTPMLEIFTSGERADRTTYSKCLIAEACHLAAESGYLGRYSQEKELEYVFWHTTETVNFMITPPMLPLSPPPPIDSKGVPELKDQDRSLARKAFEEEYRRRMSRAFVRRPLGLQPKTRREHALTIATVLAEDLASWLHNIIRGSYLSGATLLITTPSSPVYGEIVQVEASRKLFWRWASGDIRTRKVLESWAGVFDGLGIIDDTEEESYSKDDFEDEPEADGDSSAAKEQKAEEKGSKRDEAEVWPLIEEYCEVMDSISSVLPENVVSLSVFKSSVMDRSGLRAWILAQHQATNLFKPSVGSYIVVDSKNNYDSGATPARVSAIGRLFRASLEHLRDVCYRLAWDTEAVSKHLSLTFHADELMDVLSAALDSMRSSTHRTAAHPFNQKTGAINIIKSRICFLRMARRYTNKKRIKRDSEMFNDVKTAIEAEITSFRLPQNMVRGLVMAMGGKAGPDHTMILQSGLGPQCAKRVLAKWSTFFVAPKYFEDELKDIEHSGWQDIWNRTKSVLTHFYVNYTSAANSHIRVVTPDEKYAVVEEGGEQVFAESTIYEIPEPPAVVAGKGINTSKKDACSLLFSQVVRTVIMSGVAGVSRNSDIPRSVLVKLTKYGLVNEDSKSRVMLKHNVFLAGSSCTVDMEFRSENEAIALFRLLMTAHRSSVCIWKANEDSSYRVIGCVISLPMQIKRKKDAKPPLFSFLSEADRRRLITTDASLKTNLTLLQFGLDDETLIPIASAHRAGTIIPMETFSRGQSMDAEVTSAHPYLALASMYLSGVTNGLSVMRGYIALLAHIARISEDRFHDFAANMEEQFMNLEGAERTLLMKNVKEANGYFSMSRVVAGISLTPRILALQRTLTSLRTVDWLPTTVSLGGRPRDIRSLSRMKCLLKDVLGRGSENFDVSNYLYSEINAKEMFSLFGSFIKHSS